MAVSQINLLADVWAADAIHIPGSTMGEIDAMSRLETQSDPLTAFPTFEPSAWAEEDRNRRIDIIFI